MAAISQAMRDALLKQKKSIGGGLFVRNSDFKKDTIRALPKPEGILTVGVEVYSCFVKAANNSYVSPKTFELREPGLGVCRQHPRQKDARQREQDHSEFLARILDGGAAALRSRRRHQAQHQDSAGQAHGLRRNRVPYDRGGVR